MSVSIGIPEVERKRIVQGLSVLLADTAILYLKTHQFHWNVEGPMFNTLHQMFMEQYTEMWTALDVIAERIRSLGEYAPGSYKAFSQLSSMEECDSTPKAREMIAQLLKGHELLAQRARSIFEAAEAGQDEATCDLLTQRLQVHEKTAWMLRSLLTGE
jgi:starvation-inducible DNA-binding protein